MDIPSSSSSIVAPQKYGVFLSFRGTDTRNTFVSHLYEALRLQGIPTFIDSEEFQKGSEISKILDEIQKSNVSVVILSTNYADSPWCLKELVKIMECRSTQKQQVVPIFYHVDPSHVKNQTERYGVAFEKHQADEKNTAETLQCWRNALIEVANLAGCVVTDNSSEAQAIKDIVKNISDILQPVYPNDFQDLIGIQQRIQQVEFLMCIRRRDIRVIGIWGMGGLGKTTLAKALFSKYNSHFDGGCFLKDVRERSNSNGGLNQLRQDLIFQIFEGKLDNSTDKMFERLRHKKVMVILDDVDNPGQFDEIIGNCDNCGPGSRIIITSRDKQVLRSAGSHQLIYEIMALEGEESFQLFKFYALKEEDRQQDWHLDLSKQFVDYVKGNPLGLKVLGRHLRGKNEEEWRSALCKIKEGLPKDLTKALKISFDGLDFHEQQIFLDIACFFNRYPTSEVSRLLHACYGSSVKDGLRNLEDKSLVTLSSPNVDMHDLLEEMGKEVVREESRKEAGKRSRLWNHEDIEEVLTNDTGSEAVEGILMINYRKSLKIAPTAFVKMPKLKLLIFGRGLKVELPRGLKFLPRGLKFLPKDNLRHFEWPCYPLRSLPSDFIPEKLVLLNMSNSKVEQLWNGVRKFPNLQEIIMTDSKIKRLWKGVQDTPNLKIMDLSLCKHMIEMPDLSKAPKLEKLNCHRCVNLEEVSPSISDLSNLEMLDFQFCEKIRTFPSTKRMICIQKLLLPGCSNLRMFSEVSRNIKRLDLCGAQIKELPSETFRDLNALKVLNLGYCQGLGSLPNSLGCLSLLRELDVSWSSIESIPTNIRQLSQLQKLNIRGCKRLRCLPELPPSVCVLWADGCKALQTVSFSPRLTPSEVLERLKFDFDDDCIVLFSRALEHSGRVEFAFHHEYVSEFRFTDCIKLEERARENIFAFAQQMGITTVVASIINTLVSKDENCDWKRMATRFDVPGNAMSDWIPHQSGGGSSITIDFQPLNFLGFIFCAVYVPYDAVYIRFKVQLNSNHCGSRSESKPTNWMPLSKVNSQHVLLCYAPCLPNEANSQYSELSATMEVKDKNNCVTAGAVVKWGFSLIYRDGDDGNE